jgi:hypothetical protein
MGASYRLDAGAGMRRTRSTGARRRKGITLLELAVIATLAGLMLGILVPRISSFRAPMLLDGTAHGLARDLVRARGEALKRNEVVTVHRLDDTAYKVRSASGALDEAPRRLPAGLAFHGGGSVDSVRFAPFGIVSFGVGALRIDAGSNQRRVVVRTTGHVRVE